MAGTFDAYLKALRKTSLDEKTEHTDRSALEMLLKAIANEVKSGIDVQHEPPRVAGKGAPDFKISSGGLILGYAETKPIGENLDKVLKSDQIKRYKTLSTNLILTDYLHFIWISKDGVQRETLCHATDLENPKFRVRPDRVEAVTKLLQGFFSSPPEGIGKSQQLALALATRSRMLRDYLGEELVRQERDHQEGRLYGLFEIFRDQVFHELTLKEFADAFAQMLAYGLFLARLNSGQEAVTLDNARVYVPGSFRLIRELVDFLNELKEDEYSDVRWVVEEVLSIVNGLDLVSIHEDLSFRQRKAISRNMRAESEDEHRLFERDPFIYFYEDYLKAYDPAMRKGRGVYYTPPPIVNFIVRAVDDILKESFGISDGLADHKRVTVLDFACGTGTFLLEIFQRIFDNIGGPDSGRADLIVREHMLKNLYGFEYLIAPYTIAHLKLSQYLRDQGHPLKNNERLQVFLTNTLEPIEPQANLLLPAIAAETEAAQVVKEKPILVILGNPPYAYESRNNGTFIVEAIDDYRYTWERSLNFSSESGDGTLQKTSLGERNPRGLQDDYVKFIRFAQMKMDGFTYKTMAPDDKPIEHSVPGVESGIVGVITNHSWLDNATFRGMRQSLMRSFEQIYVLDLHGNAKKKERAPDGSRDENVFDIEQGVAISLFVKKSGLKRGVWRGDIWGRKLQKYEFAAASRLKNIKMIPLPTRGPDYIFIIQNLALKEVYSLGWSIADIFDIKSVGIVTARDEFTLARSQQEVWERIVSVVSDEVESVRIRYKLGRDTRDWTVAGAIADLRQEPLIRERVKPILYRPFDTRHTYLTGRSRGFLSYPRKAIWDRLGPNNLALVTSRFTKGESFAHALVSDAMIEKIILSPNTSNNGFIFPLFVTLEGSNENLSPKFRAFLDARYDHHYTPEEILGYIYAVLYAPSYRRRYAEFLRIDFPRVPFPEAAAGFEKLSILGWALVQAHLLRDLPRQGLAEYHGKGDHGVETVRYSPEEQAVHINKTQSFRPVPQTVWEFHIGGYQVLDKYLKSRKGRILSLDEINHIGAVADCLAFTLAQMAEIDMAYKAAFPGQT